MPRFSIAAGNPVFRQEAIPPLTVGSFWIKPSTVQTSICDGTQWIRLAEFSDIEANSKLLITGNEFTGFYSGLDSVPTRAQAITREVIQDVYNAASAGAGIFQNTDATRSSATFDATTQAYESGSQSAVFWETERDSVIQQTRVTGIQENYTITPSTQNQIVKITTTNSGRTYREIKLTSFDADGNEIQSTFIGGGQNPIPDPSPGVDQYVYNLSAPFSLAGAFALRITYTLDGRRSVNGIETESDNTPVPSQNGITATGTTWERSNSDGGNYTRNNVAGERFTTHTLNIEMVSGQGTVYVETNEFADEVISDYETMVFDYKTTETDPQGLVELQFNLDGTNDPHLFQRGIVYEIPPEVKAADNFRMRINLFREGTQNFHLKTWGVRFLKTREGLLTPPMPINPGQAGGGE